MNKCLCKKRKENEEYMDTYIYIEREREREIYIQWPAAQSATVPWKSMQK